ncbi:hypothetical protein FRC11_007936 [Ceratobasidium sp. 423]|nr:hypothetical protein FRC11_007936 [Ceratobasidium sp. 423]
MSSADQWRSTTLTPSNSEREESRTPPPVNREEWDCCCTPGAPEAPYDLLAHYGHNRLANDYVAEQPPGAYPWSQIEVCGSTPEPVLDQITGHAPHGLGSAITLRPHHDQHEDVNYRLLYEDLPPYPNNRYLMHGSRTAYNQSYFGPSYQEAHKRPENWETSSETSSHETSDEEEEELTQEDFGRCMAFMLSRIGTGQEREAVRTLLDLRHS